MSWYLRTRYVDPPRRQVRERLYLGNGEIWVTVDENRELLAILDDDRLAVARAAVAAAHLEELADIAPTGADRAVMTYSWNVPGSAGTWVDAAYPGELPARVDALEEVLLELEEAARR